MSGHVTVNRKLATSFIQVFHPNMPQMSISCQTIYKRLVDWHVSDHMKKESCKNAIYIKRYVRSIMDAWGFNILREKYHNYFIHNQMHSNNNQNVLRQLSTTENQGKNSTTQAYKLNWPRNVRLRRKWRIFTLKKARRKPFRVSYLKTYYS